MPKPKPSHDNPPRYLQMGKILRPHGVRGEVRTQILTDYPERFAQVERVFLGKNVFDQNATAYTIDSVRMHQAYALLLFDGIANREEADRLRGQLVMIPLDEAVPLEDGEFYLFQLIGLTVITDEGETIGTIREVLETGANDVYVIDSPTYGDVLFPALEHTVIKHDIANGQVIVHMLDGLLPEKPES